MNNYYNLKFYFWVFVCFFAWCFYYSVDAKDVVLNIKNVEDLYNYETYYVSNFSKVDNGSVVDALPHLTRRTMNIGLNCGINGRLCNVPIIEGNNQLFPSNDTQGADNWRKNFLMPEALSEFHPDTPMTSITYFEFRIDSDYSIMKVNTEYQIGIKIRKDSNLDWGSVPLNDSLLLDLNYIDDNDDVQGVSNSYITKFSQWLETDDINERVLIITFKLDSNQHVFPFDEFYCRQITFNYVSSMRETVIGNNNLEVYEVTPYTFGGNNGYGLINNRYNTPYYYKITNFYFIEDGYISFDDVAYNSSGEVIDTNDLTGYDSVEDSDLGIYESDEICGNTDVICHLRNILKHIKNLFKRIANGFLDLAKKITNGFLNVILKIGDMAYYIVDSIITGISNFFRSLFIPDDDYLENFFNGNYNFLRSKLGILFYPLELISNVLNRFLNLQTNSIINFSGFTLPIFNKELIPPFTFDFIEFFNSHQSLATLYNYYIVFITASIYISFFMLCYKKFIYLIGSGKE